MPAPQTPTLCHAILLGPLNIELVNRTLGTELAPGGLYLSRQAHWHIAKDHAEDYDACMKALKIAGERPGLIGQSPKHRDGFEIVVRFRSALSDSTRYTLIAISLERDNRGNYRVKSSYSLKEQVVERRRQNGHLKLPVI